MACGQLPQCPNFVLTQSFSRSMYPPCLRTMLPTLRLTASTLNSLYGIQRDRKTTIASDPSVIQTLTWFSFVSQSTLQTRLITSRKKYDIFSCPVMQIWIYSLSVDFRSYAFLCGSAYYPCRMQKGSSTRPTCDWGTQEDKPATCHSWRGASGTHYLLSLHYIPLTWFTGNDCSPKDWRQALSWMFCQVRRRRTRGVPICYPGSSS